MEAVAEMCFGDKMKNHGKCTGNVTTFSIAHSLHNKNFRMISLLILFIEKTMSDF